MSEVMMSKEVVEDVRKLTRSGKKEGLNAYRYPSHVVLISTEYDTGYTMILEDQIEEVSYHLKHDNRVTEFTIIELGRTTLRIVK